MSLKEVTITHELKNNLSTFVILNNITALKFLYLRQFYHVIDNGIATVFLWSSEIGWSASSKERNKYD